MDAQSFVAVKHQFCPVPCTYSHDYHPVRWNVITVRLTSRGRSTVSSVATKFTSRQIADQAVATQQMLDSVMLNFDSNKH